MGKGLRFREKLQSFWGVLTRKRVFLSRLVFVAQALFCAPLYFIQPLRHYNSRYLQVFDYGIMFNSTYVLSRLEAPFMFTRGVYAWADNQDWLQILVSWVHYTAYPHQALMLTHSLAIYFGGLLCWYAVRKDLLFSNVIPFVYWTSPFMINMNIDLVHIEAFATPLLILSYIAAVEGRQLRFLLLFALAILAKEDVAISGIVLAAALFAIRPRILLPRKVLVFAMLMSVGLFAFNMEIALPHFKRLTCDLISSDYNLAAVSDKPANPWFGSFFDTWLSPSFYLDRIANREAWFYLALLFWPLIPFAIASFPLSVSPLAGAAVNILGGGYLIKAFFHYDHSSFACLMIAMIYGSSRVRRRLPVAVYLVAGALYAHFNTVQVRPWISELFTAQSWDMRKTESVSRLETLNRVLPDDIVMSVDYSSLNHLLSGRTKTYMYPNPFTPASFGIYGLCDGITGHIDKVAAPEIVIIADSMHESADGRQWVREGYNRFMLKVSDGSGNINIWVAEDGPRRKQLELLVEGTGAESVPSDAPLFIPQQG